MGDGTPGPNFARIDWDISDRLMEAGCDGTEVAAHFGIHKETFYRRVKQDLGLDYTDYKQQKRHKGNALLRAKQYEKAVKGETSLLIWLGKNRLEQRDQPKDESNLAPKDELIKLQNELVEAKYQLLQQQKQIRESVVFRETDNQLQGSDSTS